MKALILYHPKSDHARSVETFSRDYSRQLGKSIELISLESRDGAATASLYDIVEYPSILVTSDDGRLIRAWQGRELPLMSELAYYSQ